MDKGYNSDEGWLLKTVEQDLGRLIPFLKERSGVYPPLSPFLLHFWIKLNNTELWLRTYFVIFGIALCILVYRLGKFFLDARFGLTVFFLSAISPLLIWSSQFIRSYIDSAFWAVLSTYFMMRILKKKNFWKDSLGYILSSALALYSSYLNILILISQSIFIFLFFFRDLKFLRKWLILQLLVAVLFIPCSLLLLKQLNLATAIDQKWSERGFQLFGINLGYHARSIMATFGMDPGFLWMHPLREKLNKITLVGLGAISFFIIGWFLITSLKNLKSIFENKQLIWFFPLVSVVALILYDILVEVMNFPFQPEYFVTQHVLFLFVISAVVYPVRGKNKLGILALTVISFLFVSRFQEAIKPEFETKKAYSYLVNNIKTKDCLLMVRNTNRYIEPKVFNIVMIYNYIQKDSEADYYMSLAKEARVMLAGVKEEFKSVFFYRTYGNDELLGANKLIMDWFLENGYVIKSIQKFRRIDIIHYERLD